MSSKLTTHVLDTANGCPGKRIASALWQLDLNIVLIEEAESGMGDEK
jgi:5-hydroxyisourate hydrolase-like protein (transthyretin family)